MVDGKEREKQANSRAADGVKWLEVLVWNNLRFSAWLTKNAAKSTWAYFTSINEMKWKVQYGGIFESWDKWLIFVILSDFQLLTGWGSEVQTVSTNHNKKDADVNVVAAGCRASLNQFIYSFWFLF